MKIKDFYKLIDEYAPFALSDRLCKLEDMYDNSGILIDHDDDLRSVTFALDFSASSVAAAIDNGSGLLVTHHPAVYHPIKRIDGEYVKAIRAGVGVISAHLNLDCARRGTDQSFAEALGAVNARIVDELGDGEGYGRVFSVDTDLSSFATAAKKNLKTECFVYGDKRARIKSVASFCGAGLSGDYIDKVDADLYCSADVPHHVITYALSKGRSLISFTHYGSENIGMINLYKHFCDLPIIKKEKIELYMFNDGELF